MMEIRVYSFLYVKKLNIMKFVTDRMLGKLSRWLRLFGYDTLEINKQENEDDTLLALAEKEGGFLFQGTGACQESNEKRDKNVSCPIV